MKKLLFLIFFLFLFLSPKNFLVNNVARAVDAATNLTAVPTCEKDPSTGLFTNSTITFQWHSPYGNTEDYFWKTGDASETDAGRGGQTSGSLYFQQKNLPYDTTYDWKVRVHDTGICVFGCDQTTNAPQSVKSSNCSVQPTETYDCDTGSYTCVKHTGTGIGGFATQAQCQSVCIKPQADYNYTCANRSPQCSDLTQYPASKCTDFGSASWNCPASPDGCPMTDATVSPNTNSCALSKDYVCNPSAAEGNPCNVLGCAGAQQGDCQNGLFCDRTDASPLVPGTCKKSPTDWGSLCNTCFQTDHWDAKQNSCAGPDGKPTKPGSSAYCNVSTNDQICTQGSGCVSQGTCYMCNNGTTRIGYYWDQGTSKCISVADSTTLPPISSNTCSGGDLCYQGCGCAKTAEACNNITGGVSTIVCDTTGCHARYCDSSGCYTALGFIPTAPGKFVAFLFAFFLGISGAIALILIIISGYRFMASQGNPEALQGAREQLTAAIVGLLFIIFSFVILQVIGVDILKIFSR